MLGAEVIRCSPAGGTCGRLAPRWGLASPPPSRPLPVSCPASPCPLRTPGAPGILTQRTAQALQAVRRGFEPRLPSFVGCMPSTKLLAPTLPLQLGLRFCFSLSLAVSAQGMIPGVRSLNSGGVPFCPQLVHRCLGSDKCRSWETSRESES